MRIPLSFRPAEVGGICVYQVLPFTADLEYLNILDEYCKTHQLACEYYSPCKIKRLRIYSNYQKNISGILKGIFPMTDLKTVSAAIPEGPAEKVAMPVKPEAAPVSQPEKSAPEASPTKQV